MSSCFCDKAVFVESLKRYLLEMAWKSTEIPDEAPKPKSFLFAQSDFIIFREESLIAYFCLSIIKK